MGTYKAQLFFVIITFLLLFVAVGFLLAMLLGFFQVLINFIALICQFRVKERLIYFFGVILFFTILYCVDCHYIDYPYFDDARVFIIPTFLPTILAIYSIYIAKLDDKDAEELRNKTSENIVIN